MKATILNIIPDDFDDATFNQKGGLGKVHGLFGSDLTRIWGEFLHPP